MAAILSVIVSLLEMCVSWTGHPWYAKHARIGGTVLRFRLHIIHQQVGDVSVAVSFLDRFHTSGWVPEICKSMLFEEPNWGEVLHRPHQNEDQHTR